MSNAFKIQAIRHATMVVTVEGKRILVDPMLSDKGANHANKITRNNVVNWPTVPLPVPVDDLLDVDAVLLTHVHFDHFDPVARDVLPRELPVICQPGDVAQLAALGFRIVIPVETVTEWNGLTFHRTDGSHGKGVVRKLMGQSSSFLISSGAGETLLIGGDVIYDDQFERTLDGFKPSSVVLYGGEARLVFGDPITMGSEDVVGACLALPEARIAVVHMEAMNHCGLTRQRLAEDLAACGLLERVAIPADGEIIRL